MAKFILSIFNLVIFITCALPVSAHTFHQGLTDISYNSKTGNMEIVHHFTTHDVEIALSKQLHQKINADQQNFESLLQNYTNQNFSVSKNNQPMTITWIGIEAGINETRIYQEIPLTKSLEGFTLYNQMLSDFFPDQLNRVNYSGSQMQQSLTFTHSQTSQIIVIKKSGH